MPSVSVNAVADGAADSPEAVAAPFPKTKTFPSPSPAAAATTKGRGLRRWRRIRRDQERPRDRPGGGGGAGAGGESSAASVESGLVLPPERPDLRSSYCSRSSVESGHRSSNAAVKARQQLGAAGLNGVRRVFSGRWGHADEEQLSQEVRSTGRCRGNGTSVAGRSVRSSAGEDSVGNAGNGRMHDPCNESILVLQRAQEALENEIEKIMAIRKEPSDEFDVSEDEWSGSVHLSEPNEDLIVRIKHLESRLEEASALIKEKASRIYELEAFHGQMQPGKTTIDTTNLLLSQCELDQLYQERMESEIQSIILSRAYQASPTLVKDQMTVYETEKSLSEDYKLLGLKLRNTESRAMVLEEMAEKLQLQCKELFNSSEVLQMRYKASQNSCTVAHVTCHLQELKNMLEQFASATGLQINYNKSTAVLIHMTQQSIDACITVLGCRQEGFPQTYLGLPLSNNKLRLSAF